MQSSKISRDTLSGFDKWKYKKARGIADNIYTCEFELHGELKIKNKFIEFFYYYQPNNSIDFSKPFIIEIYSDNDDHRVLLFKTHFHFNTVMDNNICLLDRVESDITNAFIKTIGNDGYLLASCLFRPVRYKFAELSKFKKRLDRGIFAHIVDFTNQQENNPFGQLLTCVDENIPLIYKIDYTIKTNDNLDSMSIYCGNFFNTGSIKFYYS